MSKPYHIHEYEPPDDEKDGRFRWIALLGAAGLWFWRRRRRKGRQADERPGVTKEALERGHIAADSVHVGAVVASGAVLLVTVVAVLGIIALMTNLLEEASPDPIQAPDAPFTGIERIPREAPLQVDPALDLLRVRRREHRRLTGYNWVDRSRGIVSIPIEQAMQMMASRADSATEPPRPSIRLLTESGYVVVTLRVPPPSSPPFLGGSPETYAVSPDVAEELGLITIKPKEE